MELDVFLREYVKAIKNDTAAVFAGAGLSCDAGFVDWKGLLCDIAEDLHLDVDKEEHDLIGVAQYHYNEHQRGRINELILNEFGRKATITENHKILARLPIKTYWTTNYDNLIETAIKDEGKIPDVKIECANLAQSKKDRDVVVYKMHGDVSQPQKAVIIRDDYEKYDNTHNLFMTALQGDLVSKTFLFLGFSFSDPNLNYILSRVRNGLEDNQRPHYCIMKRVTRDDYGNDEDYAYAKIKQEYQIKDLKRFSINTIFVDTYKEITQVLHLIELMYRKTCVFISGSAVKYDPFLKNEAQELLHRLSYELVKKDYRIITGFGLGVGTYVINGALEYMYEKSITRIDSRILMRPFPQKASGSKTLSEQWEYYRNLIISEAGVAIFVFGNKEKEDDGTIINADGVLKEFEIAKVKGLNLIPIGSTGYQTKELWQLIINDFDRYYPNERHLKPQLEILGTSTDLDEIIENVMKIISGIGGEMSKG